MTYAVTRDLSADTGNPSTDPRTGAWVRASSPATAMVLLALRTPLGTCPVDPGLGVDWRSVDKLRTSAPADAVTAIRAGLARLVSGGWVADLDATAKVRAGGVLSYSVTFLDVRLATRRTITSTRSL